MFSISLRFVRRIRPNYYCRLPLVYLSWQVDCL